MQVRKGKGMKQKVSQYEKMTQTPIHRLLIQLSIPTIITMLVSNIYNLVDTAFVGTLGTSASGAIGIVFGFMAILQAIGFLFGQGCGSILSRWLGKQNSEKASEAASVGVICSFLLATVTAVICFVLLEPLVYLLGSTETIAPYAKTYISYILVSAPFITASFTMNNILRYEGKAILGMVGMLTGAILNICGDAILIIGFHMGIAGAGLATAIAQFIGFCILLGMFLLKKTQCRLSFKYMVNNGRLIWDIILTGFPSMLRQGLNSLATVLLNTQAAVYGDAAIAAMGIVSRIVFFVFSVALGVGQGYQPISGFNYGAGKYSRIRQGYRTTLILSEAVIIVLTIVVLWKSGGIIQYFRNDPDVIEIGTRALILQSLAQIILPFCMTTEMQMQSTGKKIPALVLSSMRGGILFIPSLLILTRVRGLQGLQEAQPLAFVLSAIPTLFYAIWFFKSLPKEDRMEKAEVEIDSYS